MKANLTKAAGLLLLAGSISISWLWLSIQHFGNSAVKIEADSVTVILKPGSSVPAIARELEQGGVIENSRKLVWLTRLRGDARQIKAGEYDIARSMTINGMLDMFIAGSVKQHTFTIVEGWTFKQLREALGQHEKIQHTIAMLSDQEVMTKLGLEGQHPEGQFLPDTYLFPAQTSDLAFLKRAHNALQEELAAAWSARAEKLPYKTPYDALIMASIVEKETAVADERGEIAGVFVRRLEKRMRLQTDPTVIYGMGDSYQGNITRKDLKRDTPYNTYTRRGLPPTPIAMPGLASIKAALNPLPGESLYFVARGDGSHHFSATVEEHNKAVRKYQIRQRKQDYRTTPVEDQRS